MILRRLTLSWLCVVSSAALYGQCKIDYSAFNIYYYENFESYTTSTTMRAGLQNDSIHPWDFYRCDFGTGLVRPDAEGWGKEYYDEQQVSLQTVMDGNNTIKVCRLTGQYDLHPDSDTVRRTYRSGMLTSQCQPYSPNASGFSYGLYEIRAKLPQIDSHIQNRVDSDGDGNYDNGDAWPTFWLWHGSTEIDIVDNMVGQSSHNLVSGMINWGDFPHHHQWNDWVEMPNFVCGSIPDYDPNQDYPSGSWVCYDDKVYRSAAFIKKNVAGTVTPSDYTDLSQGFHTYTCVWTPTEVTLFVDGRVLYTIDATTIPTHDVRANIFISLQRAWSWDHPTDLHHYEIDYIKFGEFVDGNTSLPYQSTYESINYNLHKNSPSAAAVSTQHNSIVVSTQHTDEMYYLGTNHRIHKAKKDAAGDWTILEIPYNYTPNNTMYPKHDVHYHPTHRLVLYVGNDDRLQYFKMDPSTGNYYHWWIDDDWLDPDFQNRSSVSATAGSVAVLDNGIIAYIGSDNKIHTYWYNTNLNDWIYYTPVVNYNVSTHPTLPNSKKALRDLIGDHNSNIYYRGFDNRLHTLAYINGKYYHRYMDEDYSDASKELSVYDGAIAPTQDKGIFYINKNQKLHNLSYSSAQNQYLHSVVPYAYASNQVDQINGNIVWYEALDRMVYRGQDNRVQVLHLDANHTWQHWWVDDYWNTDEFNCTLTGLPTTSSSIVLNNGNAVYTSVNQELRSFIYETCLPANRLNPSHDVEVHLRSAPYRPPFVEEATPEEPALLLYPNPAQDVLFVQLDQATETQTYTIYDMNGRVLQQGNLAAYYATVNCSELQAGVYVFEVVMPSMTLRKKFVKQ